MALTRAKKEQIVGEIAQLLNESKMTVVAVYTGTSVHSMQTLKRTAKEGNTSLRVLKNRLVAKAMEQTDTFAGSDKSALKGQLLYAFNKEDEVAAAQVLANFAKTEKTIDFVGAFSADGSFINAEDIRVLSALPSKDQLRGQLVGLLNAPMSGFVNVLAGNVRGVLNVLGARAEALEG